MSFCQIARLLRNAFSNHVGRKHDALRIFTDLVFPNYRLTWADWDWWKDKNFNDYLNHFDELNGLNTHRKWTLKQLLRLTQQSALYLPIARLMKAGI
ncbi:MAG: hypothetical protein LBO72_07765 [Helicobacteraceae bacterium]|nr:hypothetical protein [Helicobacteraceae bacterium]